MLVINSFAHIYVYVCNFLGVREGGASSGSSDGARNVFGGIEVVNLVQGSLLNLRT